jgi:hypothetical protein
LDHSKAIILLVFNNSSIALGDSVLALLETVCLGWGHCTTTGGNKGELTELSKLFFFAVGLENFSIEHLSQLTWNFVRWSERGFSFAVKLEVEVKV